MPNGHLSLLGPVAITAAVLLGSCGSTEAASPDSRQAHPSAVNSSAPVVVELFQSQGCSSCPPANAYVNGIAGRPDILALSFAVTYWDKLGWKDTFGSPRYTTRQRNYASAGIGQVATPEIIVNGTRAVVGSNPRSFDVAISQAQFGEGAPAISSDGKSVGLSKTASSSKADVWLVRYDPKVRDIPIRAGENGGRTLPHRNIVREFVKLGNWSGPAKTFVLPTAGERGLATAILVQRGTGGPIITARKL